MFGQSYFIDLCTNLGCLGCSLQLHNCGYDTKRALGDLVKRINPKSYEKRWSEEDVVSI